MSKCPRRSGVPPVRRAHFPGAASGLRPQPWGEDMIRNLCLAVGVAAFALAGVANADTVSLNGSTTVMNALVMPKKAQIEAASGHQITVVGNGSQRGLADLLAGKAQIGMISAPLDEEATKINAKQPGSIDPAKL